MDTMVEDTRLPADIDAQPVVRAAAALRPVLRTYHEQIEREQRLPPALVEQLHAAGFYRMVIPRALGGLQVDPLTYLRVVELLAEGAGSVGWNLANNSIGQLVTLGLPDEGVHEIYPAGHDTVIAGTAVQGGGQAVPVEGGYRVNGRWTFGSGCQESSWMLGSFQILDGGEPRRRPDGGSLYWRGVFPRAEAEIVPGSWDVAGLRGTGSFDWTVKDVFLPERRTCPHVGVPLDNQWSRWPGITYALPSQAWVGPHHSSVITGIARAGIDALIALAVEKTPRGRTGMLCENPQVQDAVGRADAILNAGRVYRSAMIAELWNTIAAGGRDHAGAAGALPAGLDLRRRQRARGDGPGVPARRQHVVQAREPAGGVLARSARGGADGHGRRRSGTRSAGGRCWGWIRGRGCGRRRATGYVPRSALYMRARTHRSGAADRKMSREGSAAGDSRAARRSNPVSNVPVRSRRAPAAARRRSGAACTVSDRRHASVSAGTTSIADPSRLGGSLDRRIAKGGNAMQIVDAQIHLWGTGLPSNLSHRQVTHFTPEEAIALMDEGGVDAAVIHPPGWDPNSTDMAFEAVQDYPGRFAIMGAVPLDQPESRARIAGWREQPGMLGLRYGVPAAIRRGSGCTTARSTGSGRRPKRPAFRSPCWRRIR